MSAPTPALRLLFAASLTYLLVPVIVIYLPHILRSSTSIALLRPALAAGTWIGLFFLFVPLPTASFFARLSAATVGAVACLPSGYLTVSAVGILLAVMGGPLPDTETVALAIGLAATAAAVVGLGYGACGRILHMVLDPRVRTWHLGWSAWLLPSVWFSVVVFLHSALLGRWSEHNLGMVVLTFMVATAPFMIAQIALARRLALGGAVRAAG